MGIKRNTGPIRTGRGGHQKEYWSYKNRQRWASKGIQAEVGIKRNTGPIRTGMRWASKEILVP